MNLENNLLDTANQASVKVTQSDTAVALQQQLRLGDKSTLGVVLLHLFDCFPGNQKDRA